MKTVGYVISHKNGENRRALFPAQCTQLKFPEQAIFETGATVSASAFLTRTMNARV